MILSCKRIRQCILCLAMLCAGIMAAQAATRTVTKIAHTNDGVCDANCSLRETITAAASGDTIVFAASPFSVAQTITLSDAAGFQELVINKNLTITGRGARLLTIRRDAPAASDFRILTLGDNTTVTISGLTVTGGRAGQGGGILKGAGGSLTLNSVTVSSSLSTGASGGGGLDTFAATIINSTFSGNSARGNAGGGIRVNGGTTVAIANLTVSGNLAGGGGITNSGTLNLTNVTIAFNTASVFGGNILSNSTTNARNTIFANNTGRRTGCLRHGQLARQQSHWQHDGQYRLQR